MDKEYLFNWFLIILAVVAILWGIVALAGIYSYTDFYTVQRTYNTDVDTPGPNIVFKVKEIRKYGEDRTVGTFVEFDEAAKIAFEFQDKMVGLK